MDRTVSVAQYQETAVAPDMSVLDAGMIPAPPFPVHELFGPFWGDWVRAQAECLSVPADFIAYPLLSCAAALIGNSRQAYAGGDWYEPAIIWTAIVGSPSTRKTPAVNASKKLVSQVEKDLAEGYDEILRQWEAQNEAASAKREVWKADVKTASEKDYPPPELPPSAVAPDRPARPRIIANDTTPEALMALLNANKRGLLCVRDELSGWLESFDRYNKGGDRGLWLETFGAGSYTVDRKSRAEPLTVDRLSVSICGGLQPDRATSLLMSGDDDGLCARFLLTMPDPVRPKMPGAGINNEKALRAFRRLQGLSMGTDEYGNLTPITMPITSAARHAMGQWQDAAHNETCEASGLYGSHLGKMPSYVLRIALVIELMWWAAGDQTEPPREIGAQAIHAACDFMESYPRPMARRVYGEATKRPAERAAAQIARWIRQQRLSTVNARTIRREWGMPGLREARDVKEALEVLCEAGWLAEAGTRQGGGAGRKSSDYRVNSRVFE